MKELPKQGLYSITHLPEGGALWWLAESKTLTEQPILFVTRDDAHMEALRQQLAFFLPHHRTICLPAWDCQPYDRTSPHRDIAALRAERIAELAEHPLSGRSILITTANSLIQRVPAKAGMASLHHKLKTGTTIQRETLAASLTEQGYRRVSRVMEPGEFALRGSLMDIFPANEGAEGCPIRLDFFDDELESILRFDPISQTRLESITEATLYPASEIQLNQETIALFRQNFRAEFGASMQHPLYSSISEGITMAGYEHWLPLYHARMERLTDYLPPATTILWDHLALEAYHDRWNTLQDHYQNRLEFDKNPKLNGGLPPYHPLAPERLYIPPAELAILLEQCLTLAFTTHASLPQHEAMPKPLSQTPSEAKPLLELAGLKLEATQQGAASLPEQMRHVIRHFQGQKKRVLISCTTAGSQERIRQMLNPSETHMLTIQSWPEARNISAKSIGLAIAAIPHGLIAGNLVLLTEQDMLGERIIRNIKKRKSHQAFMQEAANISEGELVVHKDHGIGRFAGLETITVGGAPHDCLKIFYDGNDRLFLPVENSDAITRYGSEDDGVKLDKLGSAAWQNRKAKLRERMKLAAEALLATAAKRALSRAVAMDPPLGAYDEFCSRFPYAETDDQLRAIEDVTEDLSQEKPMDRLICGDVGFGKTEVALRAAFTAAYPHAGEQRKQVALICPTTLLARQHYKTFSERFKGLPFTIRQLSRMVSNKDAAETRNMLAEGKVDIVIGTHALLAESIHIPHLALLIIDEEQNFGVAQKEKLKSLKENVHILTLSATPIPRTLQLSLAGVKELSLITTPPVDRLAVRSFVMPFDPMMIREAVLREQTRGGKIFYVCPRIKDLDEVASRLKLLVPEVKIGIAHGQLSPTALDQMMNDFYDGQFEVLVSTNIVESGLDIPTANTLIVHKAHLFGLAQLYQLRGRVGRSNIRAYAYFTLPHGTALTHQATRRLEVMQTLDTLGAGFTIASHDMDIRGFGNILGDEQTGHIREVGMELYQQMLEDAVNAARKQKHASIDAIEPDQEWSPQINLGIAIMIPENYVEDVNLRLGLYRRAATLASEEAVTDFMAEMTDRFGPLPEEMQNLLSIVRLKILCRSCQVEKLDVGPKGAVIGFRGDSFANPMALLEFIRQRSNVKLRPDHKLVFMREWKNDQDKLTNTAQILQDIARLNHTAIAKAS